MGSRRLSASLILRLEFVFKIKFKIRDVEFELVNIQIIENYFSLVFGKEIERGL
jgi:hypothetical protein